MKIINSLHLSSADNNFGLRSGQSKNVAPDQDPSCDTLMIFLIFF